MRTTNAPIEAKVKAASLASYIAGVALMGVLNGITDANLIAGLPDVVEAFVAPMIPTAITFLAGYVARHTPRRDIVG